MKLLWISAASAALALALFESAADPSPKRVNTAPVAAKQPIKEQAAKRLATRMLLIERKKAVRDQLKASMTAQNEKIDEQRAAYEVNRELFEKNLIARETLESSEQALSASRAEMRRLREWIAEDDHSLTLAGERLQREVGGPARLVGGATAEFSHDAVAANWSLTGLEKINRFFRGRFGRALPISALGQSDTHDRLGLDHRDAVDVAVRPDSDEGRALLMYLQNAGIPFIAFRGKVTSVSTGAHIHIGPRSPRLSQREERWRADAAAAG
ncbi:MAG TPA: hypothetical protein VFV82_09040 [Candidatus Binatia bacterium]|nr:hypothetical protein [Candidatus Binatia bacterium]